MLDMYRVVVKVVCRPTVLSKYIFVLLCHYVNRTVKIVSGRERRGGIKI